MSDNQYNSLPEDQFSFNDIVRKLVSFKNLIVRNWKILILSIILGTLGGFLFERLTRKPPIYIAKIVFNMENGSSGGGGGGLQDLASAFGIGGGNSASAGLFSGDNFIELLKTKNLYNRALLTRVNVFGKNYIFGNYYLEKSGILKDELLQEVYNDLPAAQDGIAKAISVYNHLRPHSSISYKTPAEVHCSNEKVERKWKNYYVKKELSKVEVADELYR